MQSVVHSTLSSQLIGGTLPMLRSVEVVRQWPSPRHCRDSVACLQAATSCTAGYLFQQTFFVASFITRPHTGQTDFLSFSVGCLLSVSHAILYTQLYTQHQDFIYQGKMTTKQKKMSQTNSNSCLLLNQTAASVFV